MCQLWDSDIAFLCYPLGDLGVTYTVHLWLVGKRVVDRTGVQDRKKVTKGLYFSYLWRSRHWSDVYENLCSGWCSRRNHVCQVLKWNFRGYDFTGGQIFHVPIYFLNGRYNSAALLRCLWCNLVRECKMFVKDKAKISSRVGSVKWKVAYFGKLFFESDEQEFSLRGAKSQKVNSHPRRDLLKSVLKVRNAWVTVY